VSNVYDSANQKDNEQKKFQSDGSGNVAVNVKLGAGALGSFLQGVEFDFILATYPSSVVEVYTYKNGGASGTTVAVLTVTYTSASKQLISTVART